jgi:hypothetical protein
MMDSYLGSMTMRRSGAILMLVLAFALGACERSEVDGIGSNTPSEEAPPQRDLVGSVDCTVGEWGWVSGEGQVRNGAVGASTYEVVVGFYAGDVRIGGQSTWIRDIDPAETATFDAYAWLGDDAATMTSCEVVTINRWTPAVAG